MVKSHSSFGIRDGIHILTRWAYATTGSRDSVTYKTSDEGACARVGASAPYEFYILADASGPTWVALGDSGKAFVSADDTTSGFLADKLVAGSGVTLTETGGGGNETLVISAPGSTDELVGVSANDSTPDYLLNKISAGDNITIAEVGDGGNEVLAISGSANNQAAVSSNDTTPAFLATKIVAGDNITIAEVGDGGNETLAISASAGGGGASFEITDVYDSSGGVTATSTTFVDIGLDTTRINTGGMTFASNTLTCVDAGRWLIMGHTSIETAGSNSRSQSQSRLVLDTGSGFAVVPGTVGELYARQTNFGAAASFTVVLDLAVDDEIKMQINRTNGGGTITVQASASGLTCIRLGDTP